MRRIDIIRYCYYIKEGLHHLIQRAKNLFHGKKDTSRNESRILTKIKRLWEALYSFGCVWVVFVIIFFSVIFQTQLGILKYIGILIIPVILVTKRPMNIVYGLIGTSGSIRNFFFSFIFINIFFSGIYYCGFFAEAEISYDFNQPHVRYEKHDSPQCTQKDTIFIYSDYGNSYFLPEKDLPQYQQIDFFQVMRNTIMTSLIQEPTNLFDAAITYNEAMYDTTGMAAREKNAMNDQAQFDKERSELFHSILILQILISWILLGVFISILYTKFRYDS